MAKKQLPKPEKPLPNKANIPHAELQEKFKAVALLKRQTQDKQGLTIKEIQALDKQAWELLKEQEPKLYQLRQKSLHKLDRMNTTIMECNIQMNLLMELMNPKREVKVKK